MLFRSLKLTGLKSEMLDRLRTSPATGAGITDTGWRCPSCQADVDATRHDAHDADVSEAAWLLEDVERLVRMLPPAAASEGDVDDRTSLLARLDEAKESLDKLMAHKLRTWYFGKYKAEILKAVQKDPTLAFDLSDYWGKLSPKKSREAVGEGMQSGISVHGSWFVVANPPPAFRARRSRGR